MCYKLPKANRRDMPKSFAAICLLLCTSYTCAFGYLDPGTGSLLLSSFIALIASFIFLSKSIFYKAAQILMGGGQNPSYANATIIHLSFIAKVSNTTMSSPQSLAT